MLDVGRKLRDECMYYTTNIIICINICTETYVYVIFYFAQKLHKYN